jgi:4-diphosphocytidyl-2-C-methyl-D-erythritol kinase
MDLRREDHTRIAHAPAKLNLYLDVLGRRADGFHELETVMVPIRLFDTLTLLPNRSDVAGSVGDILLDVRLSGALGRSDVQDSIPKDDSNLVVRALRLLQEQSGCHLGARVGLVKRIPSTAGLGGGSSDAAMALRLANRGWGINWDTHRLAEVAAEVGSDVAFFLMGGSAICRGRGERIEPIAAVAGMHFVVVKPPAGLSTAEVYREYARQRTGRNCDRGQTLAEFILAASRGRQNGCVRHMWNGLEQAASSLSPWVDKLRMEFDRLGFVGHQLSGSGSSYFGVCRHAQHARRLANILRTRQLGLVYATRSCH